MFYIVMNALIPRSSTFFPPSWALLAALSPLACVETRRRPWCGPDSGLAPGTGTCFPTVCPSFWGLCLPYPVAPKELWPPALFGLLVNGPPFPLRDPLALLSVPPSLVVPSRPEAFLCPSFLPSTLLLWGLCTCCSRAWDALPSGEPAEGRGCAGFVHGG